MISCFFSKTLNLSKYNFKFLVMIIEPVKNFLKRLSDSAHALFENSRSNIFWLFDSFSHKLIISSDESVSNIFLWITFNKHFTTFCQFLVNKDLKWPIFTNFYCVLPAVPAVLCPSVASVGLPEPCAEESGEGGGSSDMSDVASAESEG